MPLGGDNSAATRSGHWPQRRQRALARSIAAQSLSSSSPADCMADQPRIFALTRGSHSPTRGRYTAGNGTILGIYPPVRRTPRCPERECNAHETTICNRYYVRHWTKVVQRLDDFHHTLKFLNYSRAGQVRPPDDLACGVGAAGLVPGRSRETLQEGGCRRAPVIGQASEPRRLITALEPGRRAPAGSRDAVLDHRKDLRVRVPVHVRPSFRQAHQ